MLRCALLVGLAGCSSVLGISDLNGPPGPDGPQPPQDINPNLTPCKAQRVVHVVAGNGGLAWFTQVWPVPANVTDFTATVALDNPQNFATLTTDPAHPVLARRIGMGALWDTQFQPTVFLAGVNETHTNSPTSAITSAGNGLVPAAAALQATLAPRVPVLLIGTVPYGAAPGGPPATSTADIDPFITDLQSSGVITATEASQLRPSASQIASYVDAGAPAALTALGTRLAFTANAFKLGLIGSVVMPSLADDPHGAFTNVPNVTSIANQISKAFDAFYRDLAAANETCGDDNGDFLPIANNTVMVVTGDTYKNPFMNSGWPDGTPNNTNLMYLRSNGYIKPGWFGTLTSAGGAGFFDPATGLAGGVQAADTQAAWASALYAVARGNAMALQPYTTAEFSGTKAQ